LSILAGTLDSGRNIALRHIDRAAGKRLLLGDTRTESAAPNPIVPQRAGPAAARVLLSVHLALRLGEPFAVLDVGGIRQCWEASGKHRAAAAGKRQPEGPEELGTETSRHRNARATSQRNRQPLLKLD
jgi:hypothetical protein